MTHKELLLSVCDSEDFYEFTKAPFKAGSRNVATDRKIIISVPAYDDSLPDFSERIKMFYPFERNCNIIYSVAEIKKSLAEIPQVEAMEKKITECDACSGTGRVTYEFEHGRNTYDLESDCPVCEGEGEIETEVPFPGKTMPDPEYYVKINKHKFAQFYVQKLVEIAENEGTENINLVFAPLRQHGHGFIIGSVEVLLMPVNSAEKFITLTPKA
jgi:hypothetical protein